MFMINEKNIRILKCQARDMYWPYTLLKVNGYTILTRILRKFVLVYLITFYIKRYINFQSKIYIN